MADELWDQLQRALYREGLSYKDLPETNVLLFGALGQLGFDSYLDRTKLKRQLCLSCPLLATYAARPMAPPATDFSRATEFARCGEQNSLAEQCVGALDDLWLSPGRN